MDIYVGNTDWNWYQYLRDRKMTEVNFWKPSGQTFKAIREGDLFLFKLKSAQGGKIAGGGFFVSATVTSIDWAWRAFGNENGVNNLAEFSDVIWHYKSSEGLRNPNASVTCIILTDVFYLDERDWIDISAQWNRAIVSGKTFRGQEASQLAERVSACLRGRSFADDAHDTAPEARSGYILTPSKHRIGQGAFRTLVADAYQRRCAITGERTVPVLQAAHIKSFAAEGPNAVDNGILLRSDFHALFDAGYITIEDDLRVVVSPRLHDDFGNGKDYYPYHGRRLTVVPEDRVLRPAHAYLEWHHENCFLG